MSAEDERYRRLLELIDDLQSFTKEFKPTITNNSLTIRMNGVIARALAVKEEIAKIDGGWQG